MNQQPDIEVISNCIKKKRKKDSIFTVRKESQIQNNNNKLVPLEPQNYGEIKFKSLSQVFYIQKFINNLRFQTGIIGQPTLKQKNIIQDLAYNSLGEQEETTKKSILCRLIEKEIILQEQQKQTFNSSLIIKVLTALIPPLIRPDSQSKLLFEILVTLFCIAESYYIPFELSFSYDQSDHMRIIRLCGYSLCYLEIIINFNTMIYIKGQITNDRNIIIQKYLKGQFILHLVTITPSFLLSQLSYSNSSLVAHQNSYFIYLNMLKMFFLVRFQRLNSFLKKLSITNKMSNTIHYIISLMKLLIIVSFVAHLIGCFWALVSTITINLQFEKSWIVKMDLLDELRNKNYQDIYISSIYFAFVTMITVGYGDIRAENYIEQIYLIAIVILSSIVYAFILSRIGSLISNYSQKNAEISDQTRYINIYLEKMQVNEDVCNKVRTYIQNMHDDKIYAISQGKKLLEILPQDLRLEFYYKAHKSIIENQTIIYFNFSNKLLFAFTQILNQDYILPDEIIFKEDDQDERIFFMKKGLVQIFKEKKSQFKTHLGYNSLAALDDNQTFGETSFFTGVIRCAGAKANDFTQLYYIDRKDFLQIISTNQKDKEMFHLIKDEIIYNQSYSVIKLKCYGCNRSDHMIINCPQVHFIPRKQKIVNQLIYSFLLVQDRQPALRQNRALFSHRQEHQFKTISSQSSISKSIQRFLKKQQNIIEGYITQNLQQDFVVKSITNLQQNVKSNETSPEPSFIMNAQVDEIELKQEQTYRPSFDGLNNIELEQFFTKNQQILQKSASPNSSPQLSPIVQKKQFLNSKKKSNEMENKSNQIRLSFSKMDSIKQKNKNEEQKAKDLWMEQSPLAQKAKNQKKNKRKEKKQNSQVMDFQLKFTKYHELQNSNLESNHLFWYDMDRLLETEIYYPKCNATERLSLQYLKEDLYDISFIRSYQHQQMINWGKYKIINELK